MLHAAGTEYSADHPRDRASDEISTTALCACLHMRGQRGRRRHARRTGAGSKSQLLFFFLSFFLKITSFGHFPDAGLSCCTCLLLHHIMPQSSARLSMSY